MASVVEGQGVSWQPPGVPMASHEHDAAYERWEKRLVEVVRREVQDVFDKKIALLQDSLQGGLIPSSPTPLRRDPSSPRRFTAATPARLQEGQGFTGKTKSSDWKDGTDADAAASSYAGTGSSNSGVMSMHLDSTVSAANCPGIACIKSRQWESCIESKSWDEMSELTCNFSRLELGTRHVMIGFLEIVCFFMTLPNSILLRAKAQTKALEVAAMQVVASAIFAVIFTIELVQTVTSIDVVATLREQLAMACERAEAATELRARCEEQLAAAEATASAAQSKTTEMAEALALERAAAALEAEKQEQATAALRKANQEATAALQEAQAAATAAAARASAQVVELQQALRCEQQQATKALEEAKVSAAAAAERASVDMAKLQQEIVELQADLKKATAARNGPEPAQCSTARATLRQRLAATRRYCPVIPALPAVDALNAESELRRCLTTPSATVSDLETAIKRVEILIGEAREEMKKKRFRLQRHSAERLSEAMSLGPEQLSQAIDEGRGILDQSDIIAAEARLASMRSMTPEQIAAKSRELRSSQLKKDAFIALKQDREKDLLDILVSLEKEGISWRSCRLQLHPGDACRALMQRLLAGEFPGEIAAEEEKHRGEKELTAPVVAPNATQPSHAREDDVKRKAFASAGRNVVADLEIILKRFSKEVWSTWKNGAGQDLLELALERKSGDVHMFLLGQLGLLQEQTRTPLFKGDYVWVHLPHNLQALQATIMEDTPDGADEVLCEFWEGCKEVVPRAKITKSERSL